MTAIAAFAAILLAWAPSTAYAGVDNSATVIHNPNGCAVLDGNGNVIFFEGGILVANKNHGMMSCHLKDVVNTTGQAVRVSGICFLGDLSEGIGIHGTFKSVVSQHDNGTTGDATLVCRGDVISLM